MFYFQVPELTEELLPRLDQPLKTKKDPKFGKTWVDNQITHSAHVRLPVTRSCYIRLIFVATYMNSVRFIWLYNGALATSFAITIVMVTLKVSVFVTFGQQFNLLLCWDF